MTGTVPCQQDAMVLHCLRDVVDLDALQNVVELGLVVGATRHDATIDVALAEGSEPSVARGVLAALRTSFPDVSAFNVARLSAPAA